MVQIAMLLTGIALAVKASSWRQAVTITLVVFGLALAVQTPLVGADGGFEGAVDVIIYIVIQAVSLGVAFGIERFGLHRRSALHPAV